MAELFHMQDIPGLEGIYAATRNGMIWCYAREWQAGKGRTTTHRHNGHFMTPTMSGRAYPTVRITPLNERGRNIFVHRLVALAWLGPPPSKNMTINHLNGIRTDYRIENLEWCSQLKNNLHAAKAGRSIWRMRKLTDSQADEIRQRRKSGAPIIGLSRQFGVSVMTVRQILDGKTYRTKLDG